MALQPPRYSETQRTAIRHACLDARPPITAAEATRRAAAGTLTTPAGERLDAFTMNPATARAYVSAERRRRARAVREAQGPEIAAGEIISDVLEIANRHVRKLKTRHRAGKLTSKDVRDAASMAREVHALAKLAASDAPPPQPRDTAEPGDTGALAAAAAEIAAQGPPPEPSPHGKDAETRAEPGSAHV